jgi:Tfp pilus assembly major pilin PilA
MKKNNQGFSLVEMIIIVAIIMVIASVATVSYMQYLERSNVSSDLQLLDDMRAAIYVAMTDPATEGAAKEAFTATYSSGDASGGAMVEMVLLEDDAFIGGVDDPFTRAIALTLKVSPDHIVSECHARVRSRINDSHFWFLDHPDRGFIIILSGTNRHGNRGPTPGSSRTDIDEDDIIAGADVAQPQY